MFDQQLRTWFSAIEVNTACSRAMLVLSDQSRLEFVHRVGERWAKAVGATAGDHQAAQVLAAIAQFRLNAKHLDIEFSDGSRWELPLGQRPIGTDPSR